MNLTGPILFSYIPFGDVVCCKDARSRYVYFGYAAFRRTPGDGKFAHAEPLTPGMRGTVPAGGEKIVLIVTKCRNRGFRLMIMTDEAVIVIDIP